MLSNIKENYIQVHYNILLLYIDGCGATVTRHGKSLLEHNISSLFIIIINNLLCRN